MRRFGSRGKGDAMKREVHEYYYLAKNPGIG
jgi:hypothetical protein